MPIRLPAGRSYKAARGDAVTTPVKVNPSEGHEDDEDCIKVVAGHSDSDSENRGRPNLRGATKGKPPKPKPKMPAKRQTAGAAPSSVHSLPYTTAEPIFIAIGDEEDDAKAAVPPRKHGSLTRQSSLTATGKRSIGEVQSPTRSPEPKKATVSNNTGRNALTSRRSRNKSQPENGTQISSKPSTPITGQPVPQAIDSTSQSSRSLSSLDPFRQQQPQNMRNRATEISDGLLRKELSLEAAEKRAHDLEMQVTALQSSARQAQEIVEKRIAEAVDAATKPLKEEKELLLDENERFAHLIHQQKAKLATLPKIPFDTPQDDELAKLAEELGNAVSMIARLKAEKEAQAAQIAGLQAEKEEQAAQIAKLADEYKTLTGNKDDLTQQLDEVTAKVSKRTDEELKAAVKAFQDEYTGENKTMTDDIDALNQQLVSYKADLKAVEDEYAVERKTMANDIDALNQELVACKEEVARRGEQIIALKKENQQKLAVLKKANEVLKKENQKLIVLRKDNELLVGEKSRLAEHLAEVDEVKGRIAELAGEKMRLEALLATSEEEKKKLENVVAGEPKRIARAVQAAEEELEEYYEAEKERVFAGVRRGLELLKGPHKVLCGLEKLSKSLKAGGPVGEPIVVTDDDTAGPMQGPGVDAGVRAAATAAAAGEPGPAAVASAAGGGGGGDEVPVYTTSSFAAGPVIPTLRD